LYPNVEVYNYISLIYNECESGRTRPAFQLAIEIPGLSQLHQNER
jgi:hypothetical protein